MTTTSNAMEVDEEEIPTTNPNNPIANANSNNTGNVDPNPTNNNAPKRRKKRKRDEMETDDIDTSNCNTTNSIPTNTKRRKLSAAVNTKPKYPPKWTKKMQQYCTIIKSKQKELFKASCKDTNHTSLRQSAEQELNALRQSLANGNCDLNAHIPLICKLSYGRSDGLTALVFNIRDALLLGMPNNSDDALRNTLKEKIREIILKSMTRKIYGIKPKSVNKLEERSGGSEVNAWNQCRIYEWEPLDIAHIPSEYRFDYREIKKYSVEMNKYSAFCKKYDWISHHKKGINMSMDAKDSELQKIDDGIVAWKGKQELIKQQRLMKEAAVKKKKEMKELQMRERKEKKQEMEKLKREKAEKRKKEKEEKERLKKEKMEKEKLLKKQKKQKKQTKQTKTPQKKQTKAQRKQSSIDGFFTKKSSKKGDTLSPVRDDDEQKSIYQRVFHPPKTGDVLIPNATATKDSIIQIKDNKLFISRSDGGVLPRPTAIPAVFVDINTNNNNNNNHNDDGKDTSDDIDIDMMDHGDTDRLKLQFKFRSFKEDNRPSYFGMQMNANYEGVNIAKLGRNPCSKMSDAVDYSAEDSGVEWYEDIDDLENCDHLNDCDEEEEAENALIRNQERRGLIRSDGFENDRFIVNSEDDEDGEALNDKDMMQNIARSKALRVRLKDEYPIKFIHERQRGDACDAPIVIQLPSLKRMKEEQNGLYQLTRKKASFVDAYDVETTHTERDNELEHVLAIENEEKKRKKEEDESKKKKEKKKKKKKKEKKEKKEKKKKSMKMEMDEDSEEEQEVKQAKAKVEDDDEDIQMANLNIKTPIKPQKNTLNNYFASKQLQSKCNDKAKENHNNQNQKKKKKRRVVMCELVE